VFYDPREGSIEATEFYVMNKLRTEEDEMLGDDEIKPINVSESKPKSDTAIKKALSKYAPIAEYEKKNSGKKKIKVRDGSTGNLPKP
jgi:hypothetical protein